MRFQMQNMVATDVLQYNYQIRMFCLREHFHRFPELGYVMQGEMEIELGQKKFTAREGDFFFIHPLMAHSYFTTQSCWCVVCAFPETLIDGIISARGRKGSTPVFQCSESVRRYFTDAFVKGELDGIGLRDDGRMPKSIDRHYLDLSDPAMHCRIKSIFFGVISEYIQTVPMTEPLGNADAVTKLLLYMSEHWREPLQLKSAAAAMGYSANYLSHLLRKVTGLSFCAVLNSLRVDHARSLLITTASSILDIALECGFENDRSLYRAFQQFEGCTPGEYRREFSK